MKKKVLPLLILLALSLLWLIALFQHVKAYNQMIEEKREQVGDYIVDEIMDFPPVWGLGNNPLLLATGSSLVAIWICLLIEKVPWNRFVQGKN